MIDRESATWHAITAWAEKELSDARERNDAAGLGPAETEHQRGRIAVLRELLELWHEAPARVVVQAEDYGLQTDADG